MGCGHFDGWASSPLPPIKGTAPILRGGRLRGKLAAVQLVGGMESTAFGWEPSIFLGMRAGHMVVGVSALFRDLMCGGSRFR